MIKNLHSKIDFTSVYYILALLLSFSSPFSWKISRIILILILFIWVIEANYSKVFNTIRHSRLLIVMILFVGLQLLSQTWTQTPLSENYSYFRNYFLWFSIPILVASLERRHLSPLVTAFLSAMAISEFIAYGMYFEFWTIRGHGPEYPSPFIHHTAYSVFMAVTSLILLNRIYSNLYTFKEKILMGVFFITVTGNLFISQGRTGQLAFALAILVAGIIHFRLRLKTIFISLSLIAAVFITAFYASPTFNKRFNYAVYDVSQILDGKYKSSWGNRVVWIMLGYEIMKEHPLLGVGIGDDRAIAKEYIDNERVQVSSFHQNFLPKHHFHNQYLMVIVHTGLIGLVLFLSIFYYLLRLPIENQEIKNISILFVVILLVSFISSPYLLIGEVRTMFMVFTVIFCIAALPSAITNAGKSPLPSETD